MIFEESEDSDNEIYREIMNMDGKSFKRLKLACEVKLERDKHELEDKLNFANHKVCEVILKHIIYKLIFTNTLFTILLYSH